MTATPAPELPVARTCPYAPHAGHVRLRAEAPFSRVTLPSGQEAWAVTRHEDVRAVLSDARFSPNRAHPNFPSLLKTPGKLTNKTLVSMDPPEHGPARRAVVGEFTVRRMNELRPRLQQIVDQHIDAMLAGPRPTDLVQALSLPVPSLVICELLGVPYTDHDFFQAHTASLFKRDIPVERLDREFRELRSYFAQLVTAKEAELPDDLLGRQIRKHREAGTYDHDEMVGMALLLLVAGHETTANMISLGTIGLLDHPDDLAAIKADPAKIPGAVEELLRYYTIIDIGTNRVAMEDVEIGGVHVKAGEGVAVLANMANHDWDVFTDPFSLDIDRGARHHVAFGFGAHQCLGQNLARLELQIVFDRLFARIPGLELAVPAEELPYKDDAAIYGVYQLPVTW